MRILAIETSCDETALAILTATGTKNPTFVIESHKIASQAKFHEQYGGVFPMMAKREHSKNIFPLLVSTLKDAKMLQHGKTVLPEKKLAKILDREPELLDIFLAEMPKIKKPKIDRITVTVGPGLEPTLWVGINFARALSELWNIPLVPVNHMEGHVLSIFPKANKKAFTIEKQTLPILSLLVSGGHTELVLVKDIGKYKLIGQTLDDAAGEAFDKVARMLGLPYPGGPHISKLAEEARKKNLSLHKRFPRPMIGTPNFDFSFSGLKTSVLYFIRDLKELDTQKKLEIAREFEDAVVDVLVSKTLKAVQKHKAVSIIVGGGVSANAHLKKVLETEAKKIGVRVVFPTKELSTDNAVMIGIAGFFGKPKKTLKAIGNMSL